MNYSEYVTVTPDPDAICEKIDWLVDEGLRLYEELSLTELDISKYPSLTEDAKIEQGFSAGFSDLMKKRKRKDYYIANCVCFLEIIRKVATQDAKNLIKKNKGHDLLVKTRATLLENLLFDSILILNEHRQHRITENPLYPLGKARYVDALPLWHVSHQILFGQASGLAYADLEPDLSVAVIRLVIESRIRRGTGILRKRLKANSSNIQPVKLSNIIQVLKENEGQVELPVPIQNIDRLYKWANGFIHSGTREAILSWMPKIALDYLKPFAIGTKVSSGRNALNGMRFSCAALESIREKVIELETSEVDNQEWVLELEDSIEAEIIEERTK